MFTSGYVNTETILHFFNVNFKLGNFSTVYYYVHVLSRRVLSRWMRIPFETLDPLYRSKTYRDRYQMLENAMGEASASVAVVTALMRQKLSAATDGEIDNYTDRLVEMADFQELVIDQRALVSYSLLVFVCKMVSIRI